MSYCNDCVDDPLVEKINNMCECIDNYELDDEGVECIVN